MKLDVLIIRLAFIGLLAVVGFLLNPLAFTTWLGDLDFTTRKVASAGLGAVIGLLIIAFEIRALAGFAPDVDRCCHRFDTCIIGAF